MLSKICQELVSEVKNNQYDVLRFDLIDCKKLQKIASPISQAYDNIVIIGLGASSLNVMALLSIQAKSNKKVIYLDNLDQLEINEKLLSINLAKTVFFALSRSGNTNETYLLTKYVLEILQVTPKNIHIIAPFSDNLLFNLAKSFQTHIFEHDTICSGRFGVITNACLLPALVAGVDVEKIIEAAKKRVGKFISDSSNICQIAEYYLNQYSLGRHIFVLFNYSYQLNGLCRWQQQIIAESLGKNAFGIIPLISRGTFDQHSLLQLYLEGPDDKFYKIITNNKSESDIDLSLAAHAASIYDALIKVERPVIINNFDINEETIVGEIIDTMLLIILIANHMRFNPFNQPSVDKYKRF
ncbi:MAG: hypothetical protein LN588_03150 [Rickettsia endosymbiont of Bryobia graminum]|nr:hypothetical protein [Rickettsia endosymbiont of Bryobia graminum]